MTNPSTDPVSINMASTPVAGIGGLGLVFVAGLIAWHYSMIAWATAFGMAGGLCGALIVIRWRRSHGPLGETAKKQRLLW